MTNEEKLHLQDTIDIMYDYDGFDTIESLKGLIDEMVNRLIDLQNGRIN